MNKKKQSILILISCLLLITVLAVVLVLSGRIPKNPPGTIGNTAGNLNNGGLFCEQDGVVYFSNSEVGGSLYSMNPDETNIRKLNDLKVTNILAGGNYLYYFQTGSAGPKSGFGQLPGMKSFDRCKKNGSGTAALTKDVVVTGQLVDNVLYLLTSGGSGSSFQKLNIDGSEQTPLGNELINPACALDGKIYYNGTLEDHYLYRLDTADDTVSVVWKGDLWYPLLDGGYVYYLDVANNYRLCRYSLTQDVVQVLTNDRVDCFNVGNGYIYYQKNGADPQLICMRTDGTEQRILAEGIFTGINMTSHYVYFKAFGDDSTTYHSPLGSSSYSAFYPSSM